MASKANARIAESAARTLDETFEVDGNEFDSGNFIVDISAGATGSDSVTISIDAYDPASKSWINILTSAALVANATTVYSIGKYVATAANVAIQNFLPRKFRVVASKNNATSITYSIGANYSD